MSQMESGRRKLGVDDLVALCESLQVPLRRLLVGVDAHHLQVLGLTPTDAVGSDEQGETDARPRTGRHIDRRPGG